MGNNKFAQTPAAHLARHRYRFALFNADADSAGEVFLPDDRQEEGPNWREPMASTGLPLANFERQEPDGTPDRRWLYDRH
jgi:hypothetical protein